MGESTDSEAVARLLQTVKDANALVESGQGADPSGGMQEVELAENTQGAAPAENTQGAAPAENTQGAAPAENNTTQGESSDTESSSGSDFDVDDDDSDGRKVVSDDDDDDGGMGGGGMGGSSSVVLTTRHEITDPPIPEPAVRQIPETAQLCALGTIRSVVGASVTIQSQLSGETHVLDTESLVAFEDRSVLGAVYDVFGPVARPVYTVRLRSPEEARDGRCAAGRPVFYALGWARMLATDRLRTKGNDASNEYDEEVGSDAMDFSDDDAEMAFRRQRKRERAERATGKAVPPLPLPTAPPPPPPPAAQSSAPSVAGRKLQSYEDICDPDLGF